MDSKSTQNKWFHQVIHKKFKNKSYGCINHKIRGLASRNTNSTKYSSIIYINDTNGLRCIHRRKRMKFYKSVCTNYDFESTMDSFYDNYPEYDSDSLWKDYRFTATETHLHVNHVIKTKKRKTKRRRNKNRHKHNRDFEIYWKNCVKYHKTHIVNAPQKKYRASINDDGAFNKNLKFRIVVGSREKKYSHYWTSNDVYRNAKSFVFKDEIILKPNFKLILSYFAVEDASKFCESSISNIISMNIGCETYDLFKRNKLLGIMHQHLRDPNIQHIPQKSIKQFVSKSTVNINEYINDCITDKTDTSRYRHFLSFSIWITAHQSIEYEFLQNNVAMNGDSTSVLTNVPMKLKNFILSQCSIHIHDHNTNDDDIVYDFICPQEQQLYLPIYSCPYSSIYIANAYPKTYSMLKNYQLKQLMVQYISGCFEEDTFNESVMNEMKENLMFSECHEPYYNLLPLSFKVSRILEDFIPVRHIVKRIIIPYVGYNTMHYIAMECDIEFENEYNDIQYSTDDDFDNTMNKGCSSKLRRCHKLEQDGKVYDKDIALLSIDGHEYIDVSDSDEDDFGSTTSDHTSYYFVNLFDSDSDSESW